MATLQHSGSGIAASAAATLLDMRQIAKSFGKNRVLRDVSLQVAEGEFLTILGESGSGKTTLLRIIAGFETANSGELWMSGERLDRLPPYKRRVNTVFQHYALFPHLTVEENVAYGLRVSKQAETTISSQVEQGLARVKMTAYAKAKLDLSEKATREQWDTNTRPLALDKVYYDDFCSLSRWAQAEKMTEQKIDFHQLIYDR